MKSIMVSAMTTRLVQAALTLAVLGCASTKPPSAFPNQSAPGAIYPTDVREFVKQNFVHGVPYEAASKFDLTAVPVLLGILADPGQETSWSNAVTTLGMIGDPRAVDPLIVFVSRGSGLLTSSQYAAKTSAVLALGYVVNRSQDQKALTYLGEGTNPEVWRKRQLGWASPYASTEDARNLQLAEMAILGLALSGQPSAAETLRELQARGTASGADPVQRRLGGLATEALREHAVVATKGLGGYYR
jgi:PBS lyase HEAT-like repeat